MSDKVARPRTPAKRDTSVDVDAAFLGMQDHYLALVRAYSGYRALTGSLQTHTGQLPEGERKKGLPIFTCTVPGPDGRTPIELNIDVKNINPEHVSHVLIPMINQQSSDMLTALSGVDEQLRILKPLLTAATTPNVAAE